MNDLLPLRPPPDIPDVPTAPADAPLAVDAKRLARMLGLGVKTIRSHHAAGKLPAPVRLGGRVLWRVAEIKAWLAAGCPDRATWTARTSSC